MTAPPPGRALPWGACAALTLSMALVGSYVALSRPLLALFPVLLLAWLRFAIAALAMLPWLRPGPHDAPLTRADHGLLFLASLVGTALFSLCMLYGVAMTSAVAAGVAMAGIPAAVALLSRLFLGERIAARTGWAIACAAAGIAGVALGGQGAGAPGASPAPWGYALLAGAVLCEAGYVVLGRRLATRLSARRITALVNLWGLALFTPAGLVLAGRHDFAGLTAGVWALLVFYALAAGMVSVWLWMKGVARVPAASAGVFTVWLPLSAVAVGVLVLGEPFTAAHALALLLALAAVWLAARPGSPPR